MNGGLSEAFRAVVSAIDGMPGPVFAAIDGNSGAGKSSLAALIQSARDCNVFHMDDFFLPAGRKTPERLAEPGGNADYERFKAQVADKLIGGEAFEYEIYNCAEGRVTRSARVRPKRINVVEGVYSLHPAFSGIYNLKIFLGCGRADQSERILKRGGPALLKRFEEEWIPLEDKYFEELGIAAGCDLVIRS